jgi:hypothetical protein
MMACALPGTAEGIWACALRLQAVKPTTSHAQSAGRAKESVVFGMSVLNWAGTVQATAVFAAGALRTQMSNLINQSAYNFCYV